MCVCVSFVYHLTVILVALLRALTQSTRSCWSLACRKNFLIPALMTYRWQKKKKKKSIGNKRKSESTFFCHNQATIHPLNYKQIHIQRHIEECIQPFLVSVSGHIHRHRFLWKWKTTEPRDSPTHTQQHFLCMAMMTQLDSAVSVWHHLPTSNHDGLDQQPNILTRFYSHEHEKTAFQSWRNFWVKCWLAMDQDLDAERNKVSFLSGFAINPSVLQLKPSLCLLYFLLTP